MNSFKRSLLILLALLALMLPACDYIVDAAKTGVEDYVTATTTAVLQTILPFGNAGGTS